jgi:hypothetical protein
MIGLRMIPKSLAAFVPLEVLPVHEIFDAVLLDDDELVHMTWGAIARRNNRKLLAFRDVDSFFAAIKNIDRVTPVYIDSNLQGGLKGELLIPRVAAMGFKAIFLSTGLEADEVSRVAGLSGILGKEPPAVISNPRTQAES